MSTSTGGIDYSSLDVTLVYGIFLRLIGLMYAFACGMLIKQISYLGGSRGMQPIQTRLTRIALDFPSPQRYLLFPSWLHLVHGSSPHTPQTFDRILQFGLWIGTVSGLLIALGLGDSRIWMALAWSIYLSYANMVQLLIYPWDYLLLEIGFISTLTMPRLLCLSEGFSLVSAPAPLVTLYYRWLLFRLMFGFGKMKFLGSSLKEFSYLKGFMINQPLPTFLGWFMHGLPLVVHHIGLLFFFIAEIIVPFGFVFCDGYARMACGLGTIFLQMNIEMSGNFGFFNLLSAVLSVIVGFDGGSIFLHDFAWSQVVEAPFTHVLFGLILFPLTLAYLVFNSWCTMSFMYWPSINLPLTRIGDFIRYITPWHIIHAYGIFWCQSSPAIRWVPIIEGTDDERVEGDTGSSKKQNDDVPIKWEPYHYHYMTVSPARCPPLVAPFHYRFDQSIVYDSIGMMPDTLFTSLSSGNPYDFRGNTGSGGTNLERVAQNLLLDQSPNSPMETLFRRNPFPSATRPVKALRISLYLYQPTSYEEMKRTGQYWKVKYAGPQVRQIMTRKSLILSQTVAGTTDAAERLGQQQFAPNPILKYYQLVEPSLWHPEHYLWQIQTTLFQTMTTNFELQTKYQSVSLEKILPIGLNTYVGWKSEYYTKFWFDFLPEVRQLHSRLVQTIETVTNLKKVDTNKAICECLSCQLTAASPKSSKPVFNWSHELSQLRTELLRRFSQSELFFFQLILYRFVLLLQSRVLATKTSNGSDLYHKPDAKESSKNSNEKEAALKVEEATQLLLQQKCPAFSPATAIPAPNYAYNYGLLTGPAQGERANCHDSNHLHLPSFYHLHLFLMHSVLSAKDQATATSILEKPTLTLSNVPTFALSTGLLLPGLFQFDLLKFHSAKSRLTRVITFPEQAETGGILPGFLDGYFKFLPWQFIQTEGEEFGNTAIGTDPNVSTMYSLMKESYPGTVRRPAGVQEHWHVDMSNMPDPHVDLY